jgi:hypothetical protein
VEDPERERRVADRRGGPRRERRPHRAAGKANQKPTARGCAMAERARVSGRSARGRRRRAETPGERSETRLGSRAPGARVSARAHEELTDQEPVCRLISICRELVWFRNTCERGVIVPSGALSLRLKGVPLLSIYVVTTDGPTSWPCSGCPDAETGLRHAEEGKGRDRALHKCERNRRYLFAVLFARISIPATDQFRSSGPRSIASCRSVFDA